jgi:hypothetical protein
MVRFTIFPTSSSATLWQLEDEAREMLADLRAQERGEPREPSDPKTRPKQRVRKRAE